MRCGSEDRLPFWPAVTYEVLGSVCEDSSVVIRVDQRPGGTMRASANAR